MSDGPYLYLTTTGRRSGRARVLDGAAGVSVQALSAAKYGWGDGLVVELAPDNPLT